MVTANTKVASRLLKEAIMSLKKIIFLLINLPSHHQTLGGRTEATYSHFEDSRNLSAIPCTSLALK